MLKVYQETILIHFSKYLLKRTIWTENLSHFLYPEHLASNDFTHSGGMSLAMRVTRFPHQFQKDPTLHCKHTKPSGLPNPQGTYIDSEPTVDAGTLENFGVTWLREEGVVSCHRLKNLQNPKNPFSFLLL